MKRYVSATVVYPVVVEVEIDDQLDIEEQRKVLYKAAADQDDGELIPVIYDCTDKELEE